MAITVEGEECLYLIGICPKSARHNGQDTKEHPAYRLIMWYNKEKLAWNAADIEGLSDYDTPEEALEAARNWLVGNDHENARKCFDAVNDFVGGSN